LILYRRPGVTSEKYDCASPIKFGFPVSDFSKIIKLQPGGKAAILNYNVQEPTSYSGRNFIELKLDKSYYFQIDTDKMTAVDRSIYFLHARL